MEKKIFLNPLKKLIEKDYFDLQDKKCVEVGVLRGDFSQQILKCNPEKLYLVDCWEKHPNNLRTNRFFQMCYKQVCERFLNDKRVQIIKKYSIEASKMFPDNSLDFVYIDADHSYEACSQDMRVWFLKLRKGGLLSGHDISLSRPNCGVRKSVEDFCKEYKRNYDLLSRASWGIIK